MKNLIVIVCTLISFQALAEKKPSRQIAQANTEAVWAIVDAQKIISLDANGLKFLPNFVDKNTIIQYDFCGEPGTPKTSFAKLYQATANYAIAHKLGAQLIVDIENKCVNDIMVRVSRPEDLK